MYYITKRDSETGEKFLQLKLKIKSAQTESEKEAELFGSDNFYTSRWAIEGGLEAVILNNGSLPDGTKPIGLRPSKDYNKKNVFVPDLRIKQGKEILKRWESLQVVTKKELNEIVNHKETIFSNIGYNFNNKHYVGFIVDEKWNVKVPEDCEEVTTSKFKEMFNVKNKN